MQSTVFNDKKFDYIECIDCNVIYVHPFPNESDYLAMYPPTYQSELTKSKSLIYDELFNLIKQFSKSATTFLDYGCGNGELLSQAQSQNYQVFGVEYNMEYIKHLNKSHPAIQFYDVNDFNQSMNKYDVIVLNNVLEHVTNPNVLLQQLKINLTENGILVVLGPIEENFSIAQRVRKILFSIKKKIKPSNSTHPPYHITFTNYNNQLDIFKKNQFSTLTYITNETAWPFPEKLSFSSFGIFIKSIIAFISLKFSKFINKKAGNSFIYIGKNG
jgi:SAM-dependent methyltransferase